MNPQHVLWTLQELQAVFAGETDVESGDLTEAQGGIHRVTIDSRLVKSGDLFVALAGDPGERFTPSIRSTADGHDYVADAASKGASAALVSRPQSAAIPQFQVQDTYEGLWMLGAAARRRINGPVIAVTGSSGKTTAKTFLSAALGADATKAPPPEVDERAR